MPEGATQDEQPLKLSGRDWLWIITVIAAAAVSNVVLIFSSRTQLEERLTQFTQRLEDRSEAQTKEIRNELTEVRKGLPPDWFRAMVETNARKIENLERRTDALERASITDKQTTAEQERRINALERELIKQASPGM